MRRRWLVVVGRLRVSGDRRRCAGVGLLWLALARCGPSCGPVLAVVTKHGHERGTRASVADVANGGALGVCVSAACGAWAWFLGLAVVRLCRDTTRAVRGHRKAACASGLCAADRRFAGALRLTAWALCSMILYVGCGYCVWYSYCEVHTILVTSTVGSYGQESHETSSSLQGGWIMLAERNDARLTIALPSSLLQQARAKAAQVDTTVSREVRLALRRFVASADAAWTQDVLVGGREGSERVRSADR